MCAGRIPRDQSINRSRQQSTRATKAINQSTIQPTYRGRRLEGRGRGGGRRQQQGQKPPPSPPAAVTVCDVIDTSSRSVAMVLSSVRIGSRWVGPFKSSQPSRGRQVNILCWCCDSPGLLPLLLHCLLTRPQPNRRRLIPILPIADGCAGVCTYGGVVGKASIDKGSQNIDSLAGELVCGII